MQAIFLTFFIAPFVVLGLKTSLWASVQLVGGAAICIDASSASPSQPGLKFSDKPKGGCDLPDLQSWPIGRDVQTFIVGSVATQKNAQTGNLEIGFIGCAK
ncbi:hypothetical protein PspLS_10803 [Pyricularia sp. CBS 133598]|nr:hypothetical protein PspLS_10803 [Pyricularia sp. CBS 133598]